MSIRRTLLLGFLLVGVTPAVVLALLGFDRASRSLQREIELGLVAQADAVAGDVNRLLYERLQNALTWSRLEVMQDLQVGDVDKRLSDFLQRLQRGYGGLYRRLEASNREGRIVASSDPARVGQAAGAAAPDRELQLGDARVALAWRPGPQPEFELRLPVTSSFGSGALGTLHLVFDWAQVEALLDQAADGGRQLALLDAQGRLLAGSKALREAGAALRPAPAAWAALSAGAHTVEGAAPWAGTPLLAGVGRAAGFAGFEGFGWRLMVLLPRTDALAPVRTMGGIFAAILGVVLLLTVFVSGAIAQTLSQPLLVLTQFVRTRVHGPQRKRAKDDTPPPMRGEVGELRDAFVQMLHDIEISQQNLTQASALAAVGEMSAVLAHEVRTPLGILRSSAQILRRDPAIGDEGRELLGFIESETERLAGLVSSMLDSARPRAPAFQACELNELVRHAVALLSAQAAKKDVSFTLQLDARDGALQCDPEQVTQVLLNLILNALQILQRGGRIALRTEGDDTQLRVLVGDNGPGIAPEDRTRIFEAFFFQREGGLGLGLAVVQRIVAAHGGGVDAGDSELGGALFTIRLPRRPPDLD